MQLKEKVIYSLCVKEIYINNQLNMKNLQTVIKDIQARIESYNKEDTQQLKDRKVLNELKEKRSKKSGSIKANYNMMITIMESDYNLKYGA